MQNREDSDQSDDEPLPEEEDGSDHETITDIDSETDESSDEDSDRLVSQDFEIRIFNILLPTECKRNWKNIFPYPLLAIFVYVFHSERTIQFSTMAE